LQGEVEGPSEQLDYHVDPMGGEGLSKNSTHIDSFKIDQSQPMGLFAEFGEI